MTSVEGEVGPPAPPKQHARMYLPPAGSHDESPQVT